MRLRPLLLASGLSVLLVAACDTNVPAAPFLRTELPSLFRLRGVALATDAGGYTAECALDLLFEMQTEVERTEWLVRYEGIYGGEAARTVLAPDGSGFAFSADVFGEVQAHVSAPDSVELRIPLNETAEGRFYRALARFSGTLDADGLGAGAWTCAPFDLDQGGYVDTSVVATGAWTLSPEGTAGS